MAAGSSKDEIAGSPFVEQLLKKGYEVIYFTDVLDEYVMQVGAGLVCLGLPDGQTLFLCLCLGERLSRASHQLNHPPQPSAKLKSASGQWVT